MPDLFTSLTDFTEWFSKGIEGVAGKGDSTLGTQQLRRLHDVLRPFMLRRIKKNVQSELGEKIEKDILVDLSARQKVMYRMLRSDASIKAFLAQASATSDTASRTNTLLNIVMQFRKVCNHPDLFQRPDVVSPFSFGTFSSSGELIRQKELYCPDSCRNPIEVTVPRLLWEEGGILSRPGEKSHAGFDTKYLQNLFNIWSPQNRSWDTGRGARTITARSLFEEPDVNDLPPYYKRFKLPPTRTSPFDVVRDISYGHFLTRREARFVVEDVVAPPIQASCSSRSFIVEQERKHLSETDRTALFGLPGGLADDEDVLDRARETIPELPPLGLVGNSSQDQQPLPSMAFPNVKRLMVDSAKLSRMDLLLRELKEGGHRVLVYFQMTKMMDLFEEFLVYRQHRYIRLDGSTQLGERRDLVNAWQTK
jgi:DNA helicase INO80